MNKQILSKILAVVLAFSFGISGSGILTVLKTQAVTPTRLFYSGMEEATFSDWEYRDTDWEQIGTDYKCENKSARIKSDTQGDKYIRTFGINTVGYTNLQLNFWYKIADGLGASDYVKVQWSSNATTSWNTIHAYEKVRGLPFTLFIATISV